MFGGALLGMWLARVLPEHHLNAETKDLVKLSMGLIATMAALLLGLLVASAKSSYDLRNSELTQMAANISLLDRSLAHYGPESVEARIILRIAVIQMIDQLWPKASDGGSLPPRGPGDVLFDKIQELAPHSDAQRAIQSQAGSVVINLAQARLLLIAQSGSSISTPFLVVVVFWLTVLFVSFGLFAPRNGTAIVALLVAAMSVAGALFLIIELDRPFSGLIQISSAPLQNALSALGK
jgi:hypothetical protein